MIVPTLRAAPAPVAPGLVALVAGSDASMVGAVALVARMGVLVAATGLFVAAGALEAQVSPDKPGSRVGRGAESAALQDADSAAELVLGIEYAEDPHISPDGEWVAYVHRYADRIEDRWHTEIVRVRSDGSGREPLTSGPDERSPRFSPDGSRLAYVSLSGGFWEIRVLSLATRRRRELAAASWPIGTIAWAPAGDRIAFLRHGSSLDARVHVYVADVSSGRVRQVTSTGFPPTALDLDTPLGWTPDGSALLFSADPDAAAGGRESGGDERDREGRVSPAPGSAETEVLEIPSSGGSVRRVTSRRGPDDHPAVSPDGQRVVFTSANPAADGAAPPGRQLTVLERSGGTPRPLFGRAGLDVRRPVWSPDGRQVFALVEGEGRARLALIALDGSVRFLAEGLGAGPTAAVGTASFSVSADSANPRFAATDGRPGSPGEILVGGRRLGDVARQVTWINDEVDVDALLDTEDVVVGPDVPASFLAPGGNAIPADSGPDPGARASGEGAPERSRLPAIVVIRGRCGPAFTNGFDLVPTALARSGHVVLSLDPGGRVDVVLAAADTLSSRPDVASDRLFLLERGGDGALAGRALGRGDAFRSAAVHRPPGCTAAEQATGAAPLFTIDTPHHPFDEPPSALLVRFRRTVDWLREHDPE